MRLRIRSTYRKLSRALRGPERKLLREYLGAPGAKKLHVGCGDHLIEGWLNCDLLTGWLNEQIQQGKPVYPLDAVRPYPFANNTFDAVFSEHMLEHVSYEDGSQMLAECYRVLKPGGHIRITTPDLKFLIRLYGIQKTDLQEQYIKWASEEFLDGRYPTDTFIINNFFRNWGHSFIYDEAALRQSMIHAGFVDVSLQPLGESPHFDLRNLEHEDRMPPGFLRLESMTLEAMKPTYR